MPKNTKKMRISNNPEKSLIVPSNDLSNYNKIVFDFTYFQTNSISINGFNNNYKNKMESINAVGDIFETFKNINIYDKNQFFSPAIKKQFHYNQFENDDSIDLIERVLIEGYGMPKGKVEEFERLYFEFACDDGKRVIGTKIHDNILSILFLDPNHLIYKPACRNIKEKMMYSIPGVFAKWKNDELSKQDFNQNEYLKMIVEDYNRGKYKSIDEVIENLKSIINE